MRAWMLPAGSDGFDKLYLEGELPDPEPGPGEVLIAPQAWSINYRDFAVASGNYFGGVLQKPAIPLSDGVGVVLAVGEGVTRSSRPATGCRDAFSPTGGWPAEDGHRAG